MSPEVSNSRPPSALDQDLPDADQHYKKECDDIRASIRTQLQSAASGKSLLLQKDVDDYMKWIDDDAMKQSASTYAKQVEQLRDHQTKYVPNMIRESQKFSALFYDAITKAKEEGALNTSNIEHLERVILRRNGNWLAVKQFFEKDEGNTDSFKTWMKNWKTIAKQSKEVDAYRKKMHLTADDMPELQKLDAEAKSGRVTVRLELLEKALQALTKYEHGHSILYKKAEVELRKSVNGKNLPEAQVQKQLQRIFQKYKGKALEDYVLKTLPKRAQEREPEMKEFVKLSAKAKKSGQAVLEEDEFFEKSYNERRAELTRLQKNTSPEAQKTHPLLRAAQEQIDLDNFDGAENMIAKAEAQGLGENDTKYIFDLRQQIACERESLGQAKNPDIEATIDLQKKRKDVQDELHKMHPEMREYYAWALRKGGTRMWGRMRRLRVWTYNIKWAHDHGFIPDHKRLMEIRDYASKDTEKINKEGHRDTGVEVIDTEKAGGIEGANREFGGKSRGATYFKYHHKNMAKMEEVVDAELTDERKNYWGLAVPGSDEVRLEEIIRVHNDFHPKLKALEVAQKKAGKEYEALNVNDYSIQETGMQQAA